MLCLLKPTANYFMLGFIFLSLVSCDRNALEKPLPRLVKVQPFTTTQHRQVLSYPGQLSPRFKSQLAFQVKGRLLERVIETGSPVTKGMVLAVLDAVDYDLDSENFAQQKTSAAADYQRAKNDLKRARQLRTDQFIGEAELDKAINLEASTAARLKALEAQHATSLNQRGYTQLLSPADGKITSINAEVGDILAPGRPIASLAWDKDWEFITALPENDLGTLKLGQVVAVSFWALPEQTFEGNIRVIDPVPGPESPTFVVTLSMDELPEALKLGMTGYATFTLTKEEVGLLPISSLLSSAEQTQVVVVDPDTEKTHLQLVKLGPPVGDQANIVAGLEEGQWVITAGANKIVIGEPVRVFQ